MANHRLPSKSIEEGNVILAYLPGNSQAFLNRIQVYLEAKEKFVEMSATEMRVQQRLVENALKADPNDIQALLELAVLYEVQDDLSNATDRLERILDLVEKRDCPDIYMQLGTLYEHQGDSEYALSAYREACEKWQEGGLKLRPAICLRKLPPDYQDFLVCGISSQTARYQENFDEKVQTEFDSVKLRSKQSIIRLGFLGRVGTKEIVGTIGSISDDRRKRLLKKLADYLVKENKK